MKKQNLLMTKIAMLLTGFALTSSCLVGCNYNDSKNAPSAQKKATGGPNGTSPEASVDFATVKTMVFDQACVKCHGPTLAKASLRLDQYASTFAKIDLVLSEVEGGTMPPPPPRGAILSPEQKAMLIAWIDSGAPETTVVTPPKSPVPPTTPPSTPPTTPPSTPPTTPPSTPPTTPPSTPPTTPPSTPPTTPTTPPTTPPPTPPTVPGPSPTTPDFAMVSQAVFVPHCTKCHGAMMQKGHVNLEEYANAAAHTKEIADSLDTDDMPRKAPALDPKLKAIVYAWIDAGAPETVAATPPTTPPATPPSPPTEPPTPPTVPPAAPPTEPAPAPAPLKNQ